ncbi:11422_t:CDS:1 [Diversispora eburnea]|uniref:11422_t:CDS:1 n=1 Tax=Diversispora eburnea TaxID=1213867 RepID=A0A9N9FD57_9GLOM|nr:11422_t:CDS:1 [Diversispora eburnea]
MFSYLSLLFEPKVYVKGGAGSRWVFWYYSTNGGISCGNYRIIIFSTTGFLILLILYCNISTKKKIKSKEVKTIIVRLSPEISIQVHVPTLVYIKQNNLDSMHNRSNTFFYNAGYMLFFNTLQKLIRTNPKIPTNNLALAAVIAWKRSSNEDRLEFTRLAREAGIDN